MWVGNEVVVAEAALASMTQLHVAMREETVSWLAKETSVVVVAMARMLVTASLWQ